MWQAMLCGQTPSGAGQHLKRLRVMYVVAQMLECPFVHVLISTHNGMAGTHRGWRCPDHGDLCIGNAQAPAVCIVVHAAGPVQRARCNAEDRR